MGIPRVAITWASGQRCMWESFLLAHPAAFGMNELALDFQWHQRSAHVCKEAQPPVGFATRASARLFLNILGINHLFILPLCFLLPKVRSVSTDVSDDIPICVSVAWQGQAKVAPVARPLPE